MDRNIIKEYKIPIGNHTVLYAKTFYETYPINPFEYNDGYLGNLIISRNKFIPPNSDHIRYVENENEKVNSISDAFAKACKQLNIDPQKTIFNQINYSKGDGRTLKHLDLIINSKKELNIPFQALLSDFEFIYITHDEIKKILGCIKITKKTKKKILKSFSQTLQNLENYFNGEVFAYVITKRVYDDYGEIIDEKELDSGNNYYNYEELKTSVELTLKQFKEQYQ